MRHAWARANVTHRVHLKRKVKRKDRTLIALKTSISPEIYGWKMNGHLKMVPISGDMLIVWGEGNLEIAADLEDLEVGYLYRCD